jgi:hypothetical protein
VKGDRKEMKCTECNYFVSDGSSSDCIKGVKARDEEKGCSLYRRTSMPKSVEPNITLPMKTIVIEGSELDIIPKALERFTQFREVGGVEEPFDYSYVDKGSGWMVKMVYDGDDSLVLELTPKAE